MQDNFLYPSYIAGGRGWCCVDLSEDVQGPGYFPGLPFKEEELVTKGRGSLLRGKAVY